MFRYLLFLCSALTATADKSASKERWRLIMVAVVITLAIALTISGIFLGYKHLIGYLELAKEKAEVYEWENSKLRQEISQLKLNKELIERYLRAGKLERAQMRKEAIEKISWIPKVDIIVDEDRRDNFQAFLSLLALSDLNFPNDEKKQEFMTIFTDTSKYSENYGDVNYAQLYFVFLNQFLVLSEYKEEFRDCQAFYFYVNWEKDGKKYTANLTVFEN